MAPTQVPEAQVLTLVVCDGPAKRYLVFAPSVGTVMVMVEDGFAMKLCALPSQARVVGVTPPPDSVIVPVGPDPATVQVMGCVTAASEAAKLDATGDPHPVTGSHPETAE